MQAEINLGRPLPTDSAKRDGSQENRDDLTFLSPVAAKISCVKMLSGKAAHCASPVITN